MATNRSRYINIPDSQFYIHLTKKGFLTPGNQSKIDSYTGRATLQDIYMQNSQFIRNRYIKSRMYAKDVDENVQYAKEMEAIKSLYATINSDQSQSAYAAKMSELADEVVTRVRSVHKDANMFRALSVGEIKNNMQKLIDYVRKLDELVGSIEGYDSLAIELSAENKNINSKQLKSSMGLEKDDYYLMSAFKTGQTSLKNLAEKVKLMKNLLEQNNYNKNTINRKVKYYDAGAQKERTREFSDLLGGIPTQLTNIQGAIGEIIVVAIANDAIQRKVLEPIMKTANVKQIEFEAGASGADTIENLELGLKTTSVSDSVIKIKSTSQGGYTSEMSIGISAKAVFSNPKTKEQKSKGTTFGTTTIAGLLARAQLWSHENDFQYLFTNMMTKKIDSLDSKGQYKDLYEESQAMRRYLAAKALRVMMGGLSSESNGGDTVYFLKYQDAMYSISSYFDQLASIAAQEKGTVPIVSIARGDKGENKMLSQRSGETLEEVMYRRSKAVRAKVLEMSATVTNTAGSMSLVSQMLSGGLK